MIIKLDIDCLNEHRLILVDYKSFINCSECEFNKNSLCHIIINRYSTKDMLDSLCSILNLYIPMGIPKVATLYRLIKYGEV